MKQKIAMFGIVLSLVVALLSAYTMLGMVRLVDIVILFFGGVGFGITLITYIRSMKESRKENQ